MNRAKEDRKLFFFFLKGSLRFFIPGAAASVLMTVLELAIPQLMREAVDRRMFFLWRYMALLAVGAALFRWYAQLETARGGETLVKNMQDRLYSHIARLPLSWHLTHAAGDTIQRCTSDVTMIRNFCSEQLYGLAQVILMIVLSLLFMVSMNPALTLICLLFVPLIAGGSAFFLIRLGEQFQQCDENEGLLSAIAQENLSGVRVVRAFGQEAAEERKFRAQNDIYTELWMKLCRILAWFWAFGDIFSGLQVFAVVIAGAYLCLAGRLTVGAYLAFLSYTNLLVWPVRSLGRMISELSKSEVSMKRISDILSAKPEALPPPDLPGRLYIQEAGASAAEYTRTERNLSAPSVEFRHVSFSYGTYPVLKDVCLKADAGETVGILGSTGSGKSTLMQLLLRLYELPEDGGAILMDGQDIREMSLKALRRRAGIVLQEPFLFSRTVGENIMIAWPGTEEPGSDAYRNTLDRVSAVSCLTGTVKSFLKGYDTTVGERGVTLSGGQKQRVAIARLLAADRKVLVFDDSFSSLDAETDSLIRKSLREAVRDTTVFLISHRVATLAAADRIYVLEDGRVEESGTHEELLQKNGRYAKLYRLQTLPEKLPGHCPLDAPAKLPGKLRHENACLADSTAAGKAVTG